VRSSESLSFIYFAVLTALAWLRPFPRSRRLQISVIGLAMAAAIPLLPRLATPSQRDWAPAAIILVGYYFSGRFFVTASPDLERWLMSWDRRLLGEPTTRFALWPRPLLVYLDVVYIGCFLMIPAGLVVLLATGQRHLADRYWTMVVAAEFGAFAPLSVFPTRPPWLVEGKAALPDRTVHNLASQVVEHFTIRANTFPSGHVSGSLAIAFAILGPVPWVGAGLLLLAVSITVACVVGRYHYIADCAAGALLAIIVWAVVAMMYP
jgi:membrane-associated phospholipid phosphatase